MSLKINEIFYSIQGEGPFVGYPAVFIRLSGCNENCSFCDTEHEQFVSMDEETIVRLTMDLAPDGCHLVVITGGEPFLQDFTGLARLLLDEGFDIQVETNGSVTPSVATDVLRQMTIVCSPKSQPVDQWLKHYVTAWKILVSSGTNPNSLPEDMSEDVYLQPITIGDWDSDESIANRKYAVTLCKKTGYNLSLQLHKMLEVR